MERRLHPALDHRRTALGPVAPYGADLWPGRRSLPRGGLQGRAPGPPLWHLNLREQPEVEVEVDAERFRARARTAMPEEKPRLWQQMAQIWPAYDEYQTKATREISVVLLEPVG